jgi:putative hydrolase of the HAD superfamily
MKARAVLFDLGNTLVSYYSAAEFGPILRACLRECVAVLPPDTQLNEHTLEQRALGMNVERADHAVWPLAERLGILFGSAAPGAVLQEQLITAFLKPIFATAALDPHALAVLGALRSRGFRTAVVSNTPWGSPAGAWRAELTRHGLLDVVDAAVFCVDVGYRKPHPAPIERALDLLGVRAADAVFVGDDPRWDVLGAQRAGVRPIWLSKQPADGLPEGVARVSGLSEVLDSPACGSLL